MFRSEITFSVFTTAQYQKNKIQNNIFQLICSGWAGLEVISLALNKYGFVVV